MTRHEIDFHMTRHQRRPNVRMCKRAAGHRFVTIGLHVTMLVSVLSAYASRAQAQDLNRSPDPSYDWAGPYLGGNLGVGWGTSSWTAGPGISGSSSLFQPIDHYDEGGSWFTGVQGGYNYVLPNHLLLGAEADLTAPPFPKLPTGANPFGLSIGGNTTFSSATLGAADFFETVLYSGTVRGRIGYAPGDWLFYATGGFAWSYDQQSLTQVSTGNSVSPTLWRLGWTTGAGVETPIAPHWTARLEYLYTDYGKETTNFFGGTQPVTSDFKLQELRLGLNYQFGGEDAPTGAAGAEAPADTLPDNIAIHGQGTFVYQGSSPIHASYVGTNSLPKGGELRETGDADLFFGWQPWQGAEVWLEPGFDQGFGLSGTHGMAGFPSGESYKIGYAYPYARFDRYFLRQTIDLGGASQDVDADMSQFAGKTTENRVVLTVGKFAIVDIFDTNKYANNPKSDFLNWSLVNTGTFDYAADAWGYTYGTAVEWYQGDWTPRLGIFDLSATPTGSAGSAPGYGLDGTFQQFQLDAEIEHRHTLWGQPGAIKVTGFLSRGRNGSFKDAVNLFETTGLDANDALAASRHFQSRPGASINFEQQISDTVGVFARAGWADGNTEPYDFTDIDRTVSGGVSLSGKQWDRPDDTIGIAGVINGISKIHERYFNDGGTGILIGDGQLPKYGLEKILETYYSYAVTPAVKLSADYQFAVDPAYNRQRGPVSIGAVRLHFEF